jgi:hypothetical protein
MMMRVSIHPFALTSQAFVDEGLRLNRAVGANEELCRVFRTMPKPCSHQMTPSFAEGMATLAVKIRAREMRRLVLQELRIFF